MRQLTSWALLFLFCILLCGCGGNNSTNSNANTGGMTVSVLWPDRSRLIPLASNSIRFSVSNNGSLVASQLLTRPATGGQTTAIVANLPIGNLVASAAAYPQADGTGVAQAQTSLPVTTTAGQLTPVHLTMASTVKAVSLASGQSVSVGQSTSLNFTATDAGGNVVLVSAAAASYTVVSGAGKLQSLGSQVKGVATGAASLTVTVDGITSPPQDLVVTPVAGSVWSWGETASSGVSPTSVHVSGMDNTIAIAAGYDQVLGIKSDGTVWSSGGNMFGQLGLGTNDMIGNHPPTQIPGLTGMIAVAGDYFQSLALKSDGTVWAWGRNGFGELGDSTNIERDSPVQTVGLGNVIAIAAGHAHSLALKSDGTVWAWGGNSSGQLGDGTTTDRHIPVQTVGLSNVIAIAAGAPGLALKSDGTVWAWGDGTFGNGAPADANPHPTPVRVSSLANIIAVAGGAGHSMVLKSDGTVWAWGINGNGELGDGTIMDRYTPVQTVGLSDVVAIAPGGVHSMAMKSDGTVWCWGDNDGGEEGDGTFVKRLSPVQVHNMTNAVAIAGAGGKFNLAIVGPTSRTVRPAVRTDKRPASLHASDPPATRTSGVEGDPGKALRPRP
jgi:alpha-tubulin suppressor-like RCC1 family protein